MKRSNIGVEVVGFFQVGLNLSHMCIDDCMLRKIVSRELPKRYYFFNIIILLFVHKH